MPRAYSLDLRTRVVGYVDAGHSRHAAAAHFGVSVSFFQMLYEVLIGQERGPRFGSFVALYGIPETRALIAAALAGTLR